MKKLPKSSYKYTPIGAGKLFETMTNNLTQVNNGMVLRSGIAKGVRIVQGDGSDPVAALVVDSKFSLHLRNLINCS
jgi:hypothetical protein